MSPDEKVEMRHKETIGRKRLRLEKNIFSYHHFTTK
jgi:hypothetical protein